MGVKDLWSILEPVKTRYPLDVLRGKTLAVDLSCWICESYGAKNLARSVAKPHLRNLYFRILRLYRTGASLVFVVDGDATELKWETLGKRAQSRGQGWGGGVRRSGKRSLLNSKIKECCELLDALGVPYLRSRGEAEALGGLLNSSQVVDGVITQDGDAFLYGATCVYKDMSTNSKDSHFLCYKMVDIQERLNLTRRDMVALALLLGCDYCPQGIPGVGKERALQWVELCKSHDWSCDLLQRVKLWATRKFEEDPVFLGDVERYIYRKAKCLPGFPNSKVISEYLDPVNALPSDPSAVLRWRMPNLPALRVFCSRHLEWPCEYTVSKSCEFLTQWSLRERTRGGGKEKMVPGSVFPTQIVGVRVRAGRKVYEVEWATIGDEEDDHFCTIEHREQFESAYPETCTQFFSELEEKEKKKKLKKNGRKAAAKKPPTNQQQQQQQQPDTSATPAKECDWTLQKPSFLSSSIEESKLPLSTASSSFISSRHFSSDLSDYAISERFSGLGIRQLDACCASVAITRTCTRCCASKTEPEAEDSCFGYRGNSDLLLGDDRHDENHPLLVDEHNDLLLSDNQTASSVSCLERHTFLTSDEPEECKRTDSSSELSSDDEDELPPLFARMRLARTSRQRLSTTDADDTYTGAAKCGNGGLLSGGNVEKVRGGIRKGEERGEVGKEGSSTRLESSTRCGLMYERLVSITNKLSDRGKLKDRDSSSKAQSKSESGKHLERENRYPRPSDSVSSKSYCYSSSNARIMEPHACVDKKLSMDAKRGETSDSHHPHTLQMLKEDTCARAKAKCSVVGSSPECPIELD